VYCRWTPPCLRPVYAAVYRVHARVWGLCIRPSTAVYRLRTCHVHGPFMTRPRRRPTHVRVYSPCRVHGRSRRVRAVHGHAHGPSVSQTRPCTQPVRGKTRPGTRPVPDRVRTVYTAVHGPCNGTRPSTRPSLRPVCTAVYVPYTRPCMVRP